MKRAAILFPALALAACGAPQSQSPEPAPNDWLLHAQSEKERLALIQQQLRGLDQPMWETGERFERVHDALVRENYDLALYHWDKIKLTIENGLMKRPARRANAEALFLNKVWSEVREDFSSKDAERARKGFERARDACQSCHQAEKVPFMNDQPLLELTIPEPR